MSSGSGISPLEQLPVYGSAKRYVLHFYHCLQKQFPEKKSGVHFHSFHPHFVKTAMTKPLIFTKIPFLFPRVEDWINYAMRTVRGCRGASAGYPMHEILVWMQRNCAWLIEWSFNYVPGFETLTKNKYQWDERDYASKSSNAVAPIDIPE